MRRDSNVSGLGKLLGLGFSVLGFGEFSEAGMVIRTQSREAELVADGVTEYHIDVIAESTASDVNDQEIFSSKYDVKVPANLQFVRVEFPSQNDFYANWHPDGMFHNELDSTPGTSQNLGWLQSNYRETESFEGPVNTNGILQTIVVKAPQGISPQEVYSDTRLVSFLGLPDFNTTGTSLSWSEDNRPIIIVAPGPVCIDGSSPIPGDGDGDGDVDLTDYEGFQYHMTAPGVDSQGCGDFDQDGDSDMRDAKDFMQFYSNSARGTQNMTGVDSGNVRTYGFSEGRIGRE